MVKQRITGNVICRAALILVLLSIGLLGLTVGCGPQAPEVVSLAWGSGGSTTTGYPYWTSLPKACAKYSPNIQITIMETGGGTDSWRGLNSAEYHMGIGSMSMQYQIFHGVEPFKEVASKDVRGLLVDFPSPYTFIARKDSGINTFYDQAGKKVAAAQKGTDQELNVIGLYDLLGIDVDFISATSYTDAIDMFKKGEIVGWERAAPPPHSSILEIATTTPIVVLGLTEADLKRYLNEHPEMSPMSIPPLYPGQDIEVLTIGTWAGTFTKKDAMTEDTAYQIVKAWHMGYDEFVRPLASWTQGVKDPLQAIIDGYRSPLHAGVVKYLREQGKSVPAELVPPEAK